MFERDLDLEHSLSDESCLSRLESFLEDLVRLSSLSGPVYTPLRRLLEEVEAEAEAEEEAEATAEAEEPPLYFDSKSAVF